MCNLSESKKITAIQIQDKRKNRRSIFLDHEFAFGIDVEILVKHQLVVGDELLPAKINDIIIDEQRKQAKNKAFQLLRVRARSEKEIRDRLRQSKFTQDIIIWTVDELKRLNFINAKVYSRSRMVTHPQGSFLLKRELMNFGILESDIEIGISEAYKESSELEIAEHLVIKRKRLLNIEEQKAKKKICDFLLRRGFSWDIVNEILANWEKY